MSHPLFSVLPVKYFFVHSSPPCPLLDTFHHPIKATFTTLFNSFFSHRSISLIIKRSTYNKESNNSLSIKPKTQKTNQETKEKMARPVIALALVFVALVAGLAQAISPASSPEAASIPSADSISITPSSSQAPEASSPVSSSDVETSSPPAPASEASAPNAAAPESTISAAPEAGTPNAASPVAAAGPGVSTAASDDYY